ncbi:hypothetical protein Tco_0195446 [Tanacetum coccineum]
MNMEKMFDCIQMVEGAKLLIVLKLKKVKGIDEFADKENEKKNLHTDSTYYPVTSIAINTLIRISSCFQTLMVDDMLKAQSKVIDILCNLELIYHPAFFDIMIHLVIHLPLESIFNGPIRPRWMYLFKRYIKKLKNYVRNKAKPEGSIAEGYVAEEALTFSSHYFRDVTTKFNRLDRNVDPPPRRVSFSPEIDTYRAKFKSEFPNKDMKEEFLGWFRKQIRQRHVDNDPDVSDVATRGLGLVTGGGDDRKGIRKPNLWFGQRCRQAADRQETGTAEDCSFKEGIGIPDSDGDLRPECASDKSRPQQIFEQWESSATREYSSLIHTFFLTHTVNGVFLNPEDKALYDEDAEATGSRLQHRDGCPNILEDEIMAIVRGGKQRGSDDKFSQMLSQLESQPEIGGGSGSGGCGDDEQGDDEDDDEDGEDEDDS